MRRIHRKFSMLWEGSPLGISAGRISSTPGQNRPQTGQNRPQTCKNHPQTGKGRSKTSSKPKSSTPGRYPLWGRPLGKVPRRDLKISGEAEPNPPVVPGGTVADVDGNPEPTREHYGIHTNQRGTLFRCRLLGAHCSKKQLI
jgi:hypothetical protein